MGRNINKDGNDLLHQSLQLLEHVQRRIQAEQQHHNKVMASAAAPDDMTVQQMQKQHEHLQRHWSTLQLSIWNNQACVLSELAAGVDHQIFDRLVQMGLTLTKASKVLDVRDQDRFHWTVWTLMEDNYAPAA
jgi:hypothetical protein